MIIIDFYDHQLKAIEELQNGSILCGGVGTGKSRTAIGYYFNKVCGGDLPINGSSDLTEMTNPIDLYIITTARKRDTKEWEHECAPFLLSTDINLSFCKVKLVVDSWNNIGKYVDIQNAFFIFDEQRVVGSGAWVKSFLKIVKTNQWILLSATPGDTWSDYIPVFIANGFYKNRTEFKREHVVYNRYSKFPKVDHYVNCGRLIKYRKQITVNMDYQKHTVPHKITIISDYDKYNYNQVAKYRWNIYSDEPIQEVSELCLTLRKVVNSDPSRLEKVKDILAYHPKAIIFYNFNYELNLLRNLMQELDMPYSEWNGQKHEPICTGGRWVYLVQYLAGAEGWNCVTTDTIIFYSQSYSYKSTTQAAGRIDRLNTPYTDLYYYTIRTNAPIDAAIAKTLSKKKSFNELTFINGGKK